MKKSTIALALLAVACMVAGSFAKVIPGEGNNVKVKGKVTTVLGTGDLTWTNFELDKGYTVKFGAADTFNTVTSKKASTLKGTITSDGGNVYLYNASGFAVANTFVFSSNTNVVFGLGLENGSPLSFTASGVEDGKTYFKLDSGTMNIGKLGTIYGSSTFSFGKTITLGSLELNGNGENVTVGDITILSGTEVSLAGKAIKTGNITNTNSTLKIEATDNVTTGKMTMNGATTTNITSDANVTIKDVVANDYVGATVIRTDEGTTDLGKVKINAGNDAAPFQVYGKNIKAADYTQINTVYPEFDQQFTLSATEKVTLADVSLANTRLNVAGRQSVNMGNIKQTLGGVLDVESESAVKVGTITSSADYENSSSTIIMDAGSGSLTTGNISFTTTQGRQQLSLLAANITTKDISFVETSDAYISAIVLAGSGSTTSNPINATYAKTGNIKLTHSNMYVAADNSRIGDATIAQSLLEFYNSNSLKAGNLKLDESNFKVNVPEGFDPSAVNPYDIDTSSFMGTVEISSITGGNETAPAGDAIVMADTIKVGSVNVTGALVALAANSRLNTGNITLVAGDSDFNTLVAYGDSIQMGKLKVANAIIGYTASNISVDSIVSDYVTIGNESATVKIGTLANATRTIKDEEASRDVSIKTPIDVYGENVIISSLDLCNGNGQIDITGTNMTLTNVTLVKNYLNAQMTGKVNATKVELTANSQLQVTGDVLNFKTLTANSSTLRLTADSKLDLGTVSLQFIRGPVAAPGVLYSSAESAAFTLASNGSLSVKTLTNTYGTLDIAANTLNITTLVSGVAMSTGAIKARHAESDVSTTIALLGKGTISSLTQNSGELFVNGSYISSFGDSSDTNLTVKTMRINQGNAYIYANKFTVNDLSMTNSTTNLNISDVDAITFGKVAAQGTVKVNWVSEDECTEPSRISIKAGAQFARLYLGNLNPIEKAKAAKNLTVKTYNDTNAWVEGAYEIEVRER